MFSHWKQKLYVISLKCGGGETYITVLKLFIGPRWNRWRNRPPFVIKNFITSRCETTRPPVTLVRRVLDPTIKLQPPLPSFSCICYMQEVRSHIQGSSWATGKQKKSGLDWIWIVFNFCCFFVFCFFLARLRSCLFMFRLKDLWAIKTSGWAITGFGLYTVKEGDWTIKCLCLYMSSTSHS